MEAVTIQLSPTTLSIDAAYQAVLEDHCGGISLFVGTARNHNKGESVTHLDFQAYEPMAESEMRKIGDQCIDRFGVKKVAILHRTGHVGIRDIAVIIAVSSVHREAAFKACQYAIDTLKETVPIWKKEFLENGSYWVGARP